MTRLTVTISIVIASRFPSLRGWRFLPAVAIHAWRSIVISKHVPILKLLPYYPLVAKRGPSPTVSHICGGGILSVIILLDTSSTSLYRSRLRYPCFVSPAKQLRRVCFEVGVRSSPWLWAPLLSMMKMV